MTATDPGNSAARSLIAYATQLVMVLSAVRMAHVGLVYFAEKRLMGSLNCTLAFELVATHRVDEPSPAASEGEEELPVVQAAVALSVPVERESATSDAASQGDAHGSENSDAPSDNDGAPTAVRRVFTHDAKSRELYHAVEEMLSVMRDDRERERLREEEAARERLLWEEADDILAGPAPQTVASAADANTPSAVVNETLPHAIEIVPSSDDILAGPAPRAIASAAVANTPSAVVDEILLGSSTRAAAIEIVPSSDDILAGPPPVLSLNDTTEEDADLTTFGEGSCKRCFAVPSVASVVRGRG